MTTNIAEKKLLDQRKLRSIKYTFIGIFLVTIACIGYLVDPLESVLESQLEMREGSYLFKVFKNPPVEVIMKVYIFNVTNAAEYMSGEDKKLNVSEIGPYVFQEIVEHRNHTFHENGTLSYSPYRKMIALPERSVGNYETDIVVTPNIPLLGISTMLTELSSIAAIGISALTKSHNAQPILNLTVHDYLWGYEDKLVTLASKLAPKLINFDKFGIMDRLLDEGENLVNMNLPEAVLKLKEKARKKKRGPVTEYLRSLSDSNEDTRQMLTMNQLLEEHELSSEEGDDEDPAFDPTVRDYSINNYNGNPGLSHWGYVNPYDTRNKYHLQHNIPCNTVRGAYDGTVFPKRVKKNETFKLYRKAFCRTLPITFSHEGERLGLKAYWFHLDENAFNDDVNDPNSKCYCKKTCLKRGLGSITPCYYNIPAAVSLPHFYKSDPSLLNEVNGLSPDAEKHDSIVIMQPRLGIPISAYTRMQLNLIIGDIKFNTKLKKFTNTVIPAFWMQLAIEKITPSLEFFLYASFNVLPYVQTAVIFLSLIIGLSLLSTAALLAFCVPKVTQNKYKSKPSIRYSAISMFPYIKRGMEMYGDIEDDNDRSVQRSDNEQLAEGSV